MSFRIKTLAVIAITALGALTPALAAQANDLYPAETKYWVDCSLGFRNIDCIESIEFSDPASEKRDDKGFLDYSSLVWKKVMVAPNPKFTYKSLPPESAWKNEEYGVPCVGSRPNYGDGYLHDACYTASGLNPDGSDIIFHLMFGSNGESFEIYQWVDKGVRRSWNREDGWVAQTLPEGSTWRLTLKSNTLAQNTGVLTSNLKNPNITTIKGSDGVSRTVVIGSVYPNQYGCMVPGQTFDPRANREITCNNPESYAQTASTGFTISISPYIYQFEKLKGYIPGGIFVSGSAGSLGQVQYDQNLGIITVPMFGPHYLFDRKTLNKGWMETAIKGEVIRKAFNLDPSQAGNIVKVEISEGDGKSEIATYTSRYLKTLDVFEIKAYNFGFSSPTLRVKLKPIVQSSSAGNSPVAAPKPGQTNRVTISCVKGKTIKKISGVKPKCPTGFRKK